MKKKSMEKSPPSSNGSRELQCVGRMEIVKPKPVGFLCGSIPVPTDKAFYAFNSALVPSTQTVRAPRYQMLPTETNLNMPPLLPNMREKLLPDAATQSRTSGDLPWESGAMTSNLTRKGESLAVSGLVEYGDEIDVIAPADIMKQIFKIPYSKARLSIAVRRIGQTLVLNTGPDIEEAEKLVRRHNSRSNGADQSLFLNFAMHSVRMEACDCPPAHQAPPKEKSNSSVLPGKFDSREGLFESSDHPVQVHKSQFFEQSDDIAQEGGLNHCPEYQQVKQDKFLWGSKKNRRNKGHDTVKKASQVKEKPRSLMLESEKYRRPRNDDFLRVLFWQFHNFRMLLGSDLLLFSNERYLGVSLHLWDVSRQVTPLTWLEAWLDNVMASVPELAICYHQDGVVQGYELIKTDDIFLLKGISDDGTPAFHPHVVQQNGLSVLRFLQDKCKQDPGAYWLYKSAGEDVIQLFNLSVIPKNHSPNDCNDSSVSVPSLIHRGRSDSLLSLGTLLYRIAHRLSISMSRNNRAKCVRFFKKCLDFLDEPDHLVVRASAHEQFARLLLTYDEGFELSSEALPVETEVTVADAEGESVDLLSSISEPIAHDIVCYHIEDYTTNPTKDTEAFQDPQPEFPVQMTMSATVSVSRTLIESGESDLGDPVSDPCSGNESFAVCSTSTTASHNGQSPISSKLEAVHHVSQAIKSLRGKRQRQSTEPELEKGCRTQDKPASSMEFSVCACGDADCIEFCDIWDWLPTSKLDDKLWQLVLLLGESYLALAQAYKDDGQLHQALKIVDLASFVYGSVPQHLKDTRFVSSMIYSLPSQTGTNDRSDKTKTFRVDASKVGSSSEDSCHTYGRFTSTYLFWAKAWTLVGDVYVEFLYQDDAIQADRKPATKWRMTSEVFKEFKRLKKKLGQSNQNCSSCSLVNCSCQSDRASSGSSASSSTGDSCPLGYGRKQSKRSYVKSSPYSRLGNPEDGSIHDKVENGNSSDSGYLKHDRSGDTLIGASNTVTDAPGENILDAGVSEKVEGTAEAGSETVAQTDSDARETTKVKNGGIFKYLEGPLIGDVEYNLSASLSCYEEARKALGEDPHCSAEIKSVVKKKGWVCNELGRKRLERKELDKAELAFADAIRAFKRVADHTNIILINCNMGHGRRALAEEMVSKMESLKNHPIFSNAFNQALKTAKLEYGKSLRYYGEAKTELNAIAEEADPESSRLRNEVHTQFAHTYLRLGMLLAREDTILEVNGSGAWEDFRAQKEFRKHEISANDAIREAISLYELLGELRRQEAAYAYFQLACYQRDCCLRFLESDKKKGDLSKGDNIIPQKVKQYSLLAERNWQKSIDFYGPKTHSIMYLTIVMERSALSLNLSSSFHSNSMLESALNNLLEGRHVYEKTSDSLTKENPDLYAKFWSQLQMLLKKMLATALSTSTNKSSLNAQPTSSNRSGDVGKLRELYKMSLKATDLGQLHAMHSVWTS